MLTTPCIEWPGYRNAQGYGRINRQCRVQFVHRWAWAQTYGPIPEGMILRHRCDNPPCYRLDHLVLCSRRENTDDMVQKGRQAVGHRVHGRLTESDVRAIRRRAASGETRASLAAEFGTAHSNVSNIVNRKIWRSVS